MANNDRDDGGMEADVAAPLLQGQPPELFADSTKHDDDRSYGEGLRHRRHVAGRKTKKITGMSPSSEMIDSDEEHGGMEADTTTPLLLGQHPELLAERTHDDDSINESLDDMTESDEEHGEMEAGDMATPLLLGQRPELRADRTHDDDSINEDGLGRCRTVPGRKMAKITVKYITGRSYQLEVDLSSDTIHDVMASIKEESGYPFHQQRIVFNQILQQNDCILAHCGIKDGSTVNMVPRLRGGGRDAKESKELWCTYSHKALLFSVALFSAYLNNNSTSTSPNIVRDIFFVIFVIAHAALSLALDLPQLVTVRLPISSEGYYCGDALVWISCFLLELVTCLLSISFNIYYAFIFLPSLLAFVFAPLAFTFHGDTGNDEDTKDEYDRLFKLSEGITSCAGLISVVLGHYDTVVGPGKVAVGVFFFSTIALGLYLMLVITVRAASCRHATWLARVLVVLVLVTLIIASVDFIRSQLRSHPQVLQTQQQHAWPPSANAFSRSNLRA